MHHTSLSALIATSQYLACFDTFLEDKLVTVYRLVRAFDQDDASAQVAAYLHAEGVQVVGGLHVVPM